MKTTSFITHPICGLGQSSLTPQQICRTRRTPATKARRMTRASYSSTSDNMQSNLSSSSQGLQNLEEGEGGGEEDDDDDEGTFIVNLEDDEGEYESDEKMNEDDELMVVNVSPPPQRTKKQRRNTTALLDAITSEPDPNTSFTSDADSIPDLNKDESLSIVRAIVEAADIRKGEDIMALRVSKLTYITSFVVIVTGNNSPQLRAIANLVEEELSKKHFMEPRRIDGVPSSGWLLLDYGDVMVNVFSKEQRNAYNLEKLWSRAEEVDVSSWLIGPNEASKEEISQSALDDWIGEE